MNFADSERLKALLLGNGLTEVSSPEEADVVIVNSCSVRKHAEDRMFGFFSSIKNLKKDGKVFCLFGCTANLYGERIFEKYKFIDVVCGPNRFGESISLIKKAFEGKRVAATGESKNPFMDEILLADGEISCSVAITKGCQNFCSYCVVPYARDSLVSKSSEKILKEVKELAGRGVREIVLLGQNVNEYGKDSGGTNFVELLEKIHQIDGILRISFLTSHPKDVPEKLLLSFKSLPKLCNHFHLPLQSGSDRILKLMNRKYTISHYLDIIKTARSFVPDISITSDIIVGFPTESEEDFMETYNTVKEIKFDDLFVFKYSSRAGTSASKLQDDVPVKEKERRHQLILNLQERITEGINQGYIGKTVDVFVQKESYKKRGCLVGKTETKKTVLFKGDVSLVGKIMKVKITDSSIHFLPGELCGNKE